MRISAAQESNERYYKHHTSAGALHLVELARQQREGFAHEAAKRFDLLQARQPGELLRVAAYVLVGIDAHVRSGLANSREGREGTGGEQT